MRILRKAVKKLIRIKKTFPALTALLCGAIILSPFSTVSLTAASLNVPADESESSVNDLRTYPGSAEVSASAMHAYVQSVIDEITTGDMTDEQKLKACFDYCLSSMSYQRDTAPGEESLIEDYALEAFFTHKGNCYRYSAMFAYLAKELGFNASVHAGECSSTKGGMTPHSWVQIDYPDGHSLIYDGSFGDSAKGKKNYFGITEQQHSRKLVTLEIWQTIY